MFKIFCLFLLCLATVSCSSLRPERETGFLPANLQYKEHNGMATIYWADNGFKLADYPKVMVLPVELWLSPDFEEKENITVEQANELAIYFHDQIVEQFKKNGLLVNKPGKGVAKLMIAITDVVPSTLFLNTLSAINPPGIIISLGQQAITGKPSSVGEVELALMLKDSQTNKLLAVVKSRRAGDKYDFSGHIDRLGNARSKLQEWAEELVKAWLKSEQK